MSSHDFQNDQVLTIKEVAAKLRVHSSQISRFAISGELVSYKVGGRRLFWESDVLAFFEKWRNR